MISSVPVSSNVAIFSASKSRAADNTIEEKFLTGGMLAITSAGSPACTENVAAGTP